MRLSFYFILYLHIRTKKHLTNSGKDNAHTVPFQCTACCTASALTIALLVH